MNIYLIRHSKVNINPSEICYGQSDIELKRGYIADFKKIKQRLACKENKLIVTSPLKRCYILARYLAKDSTSKVIKDNRLLEMNFGDWELQRWDEINKEDSKRWTDDIVNNKCPNGEAYKDLIKRATNFWLDIREQQHKNIIVVSHKGVILSILANILNMPFERAFKIKIDFLGISKITYNNGQTQLLYTND